MADHVSPAIVAVCLNPAIDVTYRVAVLEPGTSHRVLPVGRRAGGKATNVVRVARRLGCPATLVAPVGGSTGVEFSADLTAEGVAAELVPVDGTTRTSVTVVDAADATVFNEPGPVLSGHEWRELLATIGTLATPGDVLVVSGSMPPGAPDSASAELVDLAHRIGCRVVLDVSGEQLRAALPHRPDVVAPNRHEAAETLGLQAGPGELAEALRARGAVAAVVSDGADGLVASTPDGRWHAYLAESLAGNPTGAGDALTAALAVGLVNDRGWVDVLRDAVALSASAVVAHVAGEFDAPTRARLHPFVLIEEV